MLAENIYRFSAHVEVVDSELKAGKYLASLSYFCIAIVLGIQIYYLQQMAELYVKIRSQTPEETFQKFKVFKRIYAFMS